MTQSKLLIVVSAIAALAMIACGDSDPKNTPSDGSMNTPSDGSMNTPSDGSIDGDGNATQCWYDGNLYKTGDVFCSVDGCNSCQCNPEGTLGVGCTTKNCEASGVISADVCNSGSQCSYNGNVYQTGDIFCSVDGCNSCQCNPEGTVGVGCSLKDCNVPGVVLADVCKPVGG